MERRVGPRGSFLGPQAIPVVVVYRPELALAVVDLGDDGLVVRVDGPVRLHPFSQRSAAAVPSSLMIAVTKGWKSVSEGAKPTFPFHCGEASSRIELGSSAGFSLEVCRRGPRFALRPRPTARGRSHSGSGLPPASSSPPARAGRPRRAFPGPGCSPCRRRPPGSSALLFDLVAERRLVVRADLDLDPRLTFEGLHQQRGRLFVLAVVERQAASGAAAGAEQQCEREQEWGARAIGVLRLIRLNPSFPVGMTSET